MVEVAALTYPAVASSVRPFIGLRPFEYGDRLYFFGRKQSVDAIEPLVNRNRFVAVVGGSGSGKSSLIMAGLLPRLEAREDIHWRWTTMRPGESPLHRLAQALASLTGTSGDLLEAWAGRIEILLWQSSFGISEAVSLFPAQIQSSQLLLIVDQFEELFRFADVRAERNNDFYTTSQHRDEATAFVRLLLNAAKTAQLPLRIVITMRADFIGDCSHFHGLPEAVTSCQFLVPGLTRDQRADAITMPLREAGASIDPGLVQRILNDTSDDPDQLPIIQHTMMRIWQAAKRRSLELGTLLELRLEDYTNIGGVANALSNHANEILAKLEREGAGSEAGIPLGIVTKRIFQALTEIDQDARVSRRPQRFGDLKKCIGSDEAVGDIDRAARLVVDRFAEPECSFLRAPSEAELNDYSIVDIGHEALIRRWSKLKGDGEVDWVREEQEDAEKYRDLVRIARAGRVIPADELPTLEKWWDLRRPSAHWAKQYTAVGEDYFEAVKDTLKRSAEKAEADRQAAARIQSREREMVEARLKAEAAEARANAKIAAEKASFAQLKLRTRMQLFRVVGALGAAILALSLLGVGLWYRNQQNLIAEKSKSATQLLSVVAKSILSTRRMSGPADSIALLLAKPDRLPLTDSYLEALYNSLSMLREKRRITDLPAPVLSVVFNPQKKMLLGVTAGSQPTLLFWDSAGSLIDQMPAPIRGVGWVRGAWSPDGEKLLIASTQNAMIVTPCGSGKLRRYFSACGHVAEDIKVRLGTDENSAGIGVWSGDGNSVITSTFTGPANAWDARTGNWDSSLHDALAKLPLDMKDAKGMFATSSIAASRGGEYLAIGGASGDIIILDGRTKSIIRYLKPDGQKSSVFYLEFDPTNADNLFVLYQIAKPQLWNVKAGTAQKLDLPEGNGFQGAYDPKGRFIAIAANTGIVYLWDPRPDAKTRLVDLRGHLGTVLTVDINDDGSIASGSNDKTVRIWSPDPVAVLPPARPDFNNAEAVAALASEAQNSLPLNGDTRLTLAPDIRCNLLGDCDSKAGQ